MPDSDTGFAVGCGLGLALLMVVAAGAYVTLRPVPASVTNGPSAAPVTAVAPAAPIVPAGPMVPVAPVEPVAPAATPASVVLADDITQRVVRTHFTSLRHACLERAAGHDADLEITAVLDAAGQVTSTTVSGTDDHRLSSCVEHAVGSWTFPAPGIAGAQSRFTLHLTH